MSSCPANFGGLETTDNIVGCECPSCRMAADKLPFRLVSDLYDSVDLGLPLYKFFETDMLKQFLEKLVVTGNARGKGRLIVILLQDGVGGVAVNAHPLNVHSHICASLLLKDSEDVSVKAGPVNAGHIREALTEVAGEDEHIPYLLQFP